MEFLLTRKWFTDESTIGILTVDGGHECYILEDAKRAEKVYGKTCIPEGRYKIIITPSPRFKRKLPLLVNVPGYDGVRIHPGNTAEDTEGCLLPGVYRADNRVGDSRVAFDRLYLKLSQSEDNWITIV